MVWQRSPTTIIEIPANSKELVVPNISFNLWWIWSKVVFPTMDISSIITSFNSDNMTLICFFFLVWHSRYMITSYFWNARSVLIAVPSIFIAGTPVGAIRGTVGNSGLIVQLLMTTIVQIGDKSMKLSAITNWPEGDKWYRAKQKNFYRVPWTSLLMTSLIDGKSKISDMWQFD